MIYLSVTLMILCICYVSPGVLFIVERQQTDGLPGQRRPAPLRWCRQLRPRRAAARPDDIPATKVNTDARTKRQAVRDRLFIPSVAWPELAHAVAAGMSGRAMGLWLAIRMQAKLERTGWVRVRAHLRESLGFTNRAAHSRAMAELERAGLIEVQRRKGFAPLVRLVQRATLEGGAED
jgi:hypothetical protein